MLDGNKRQTTKIFQEIDENFSLFTNHVFPKIVSGKMNYGGYRARSDYAMSKKPNPL